MRVTGRGYWKGAKMCLGRCCGSEKTGHLKGRTAHLKGRTEHLKGRAKHLAGRVTGRDCGIIRVRLGKVDCVFVVTHGLRKVSE